METGFEKLRVYKLSLEGVKLIHLLTLKSVIKRNFSLVDQIMRAAMSVCANIAEGYGRRSKKDFVQFLSVAIGSVNEVIAFLDIIGLLYSNIDIFREKDYYISLGKQIWSLRKRASNF